MEQVKFKDIIHLYWGCDAHINEGRTTIKAPITETTIAKVKSGSWECKPILRKLSDMTIEEGAWCLSEVFFDHVKYDLRDFKIELVGEGKNPRISIDNDWYNENLTLGNNTGSLWSVDVSSNKVKVPATVFLYLLKQGFDLFGLIENGDAIDKATLK